MKDLLRFCYARKYFPALSHELRFAVTELSYSKAINKSRAERCVAAATGAVRTGYV